MITILIVETSEQAELAQLLSAHPLDFVTSSAEGCAEARELLRQRACDALVVDLRLGEEAERLLLDVKQAHPAMGRFALLQQEDFVLRKRLSELGVIACMVEPLDPTMALVQITRGLAETFYGSLYNINLPAFLQLLEIERKTCTVRILSAGREGTMYVSAGEMQDARMDGMSGEPAAFAIIGWLSGNVEIEHGCLVAERTIHKPISHLLMNALQYKDENGKSIPVEFDSDEMSFKRLQESLAPLKSEFPPSPRLPSFLARLPRAMVLPPGSLGLALVDAETGLTLASESKPAIDISRWAENAANVLRQEYVTLATSAQDAELVELVVSTESYCELIKPLPKRHRCFALFLFDPNETNLVMARFEVERWVSEHT